MINHYLDLTVDRGLLMLMYGDDYKVQGKNSIVRLLYADVNNAVLFLLVYTARFIYKIRAPPRVLL